MTVLTALMLLLVLGFGLFILHDGWGSFDVVRQLLGRPTSRIAEIQDGRIEVAGVVSAEEPVQASHGADCAVVAIEIVHEWTSGSGKQASTKTSTKIRTDTARDITLDDGTGSCRLLIKEEMIVVAYQRRWSMDYHEFCSRYPGDTSLLGDSARGTVTRYERSIELGKRALVSGFATPDPETAPGGYRQGAGARYLIGGDSEHKLLVVAGGQTLGALRSGLPAALMLLIGLALLGMGLWMTRVYVAILWG